MTNSTRINISLLFILLLPALGFAVGDEETWRPITPAELAMKTPVVEADADAEAIFWEVNVDDKKRNKLFYTHYVRVKIFTERGRERFSKFDIPFVKGKKVEDVAARVIKPDGTIIELKPTDIFERDIIQVDKIKVRAKSFAVPGIEPGVIVEYRYKETFKGDSADGERLMFQRDIPIQTVAYYVRPYQNTTLDLDFRNMATTKFVKDKDGFYVARMTNVPAFKKEPQMPPEEEIRSWVGLSYRNAFSSGWNLFGTTLTKAFGQLIKPSNDISQKAAELTSEAPSDQEKLKRIYEFVQKQIRNISFDASLTNEQRESLKLKDADEVLRRRMGSEGDINLLFASLAKAAGFEVYLALSGDRSQNFFNPQKSVSPSYVHPTGIIVTPAANTNGESAINTNGPSASDVPFISTKIGNDLKVYNPGVPFLPFGKVFWFEENVQALVVNEHSFGWRKIPLSDYTQSPVKRTGKFKLLEDGTLEGTVRLEYNGHQAILRRQSDFKDSETTREENIKKEIKETVSTAEISDISIENFDDPAKPLVYIFKIRVSNYAQQTGKRLFLQPGFFEYNSKPLFSSSTRIHPIYFSYPWSEEDDIEIEMPKGFSPESAEAPNAVVETQKIGSLNISIGSDKITNSINYKRNFYFGGEGTLLFPAASYQPLKTLFDKFYIANTHTITLRKNEN